MRQNLHAHHDNLVLKNTSNFYPTTQFATTRDNKKIAYWYFPAQKSKGVVILAHGYGNPGGKSVMIGHAKYLEEAGYSTALVDLRAYGESEGDQITLGVHEWKDLEAVYDKMKALPENSGKKIGYLGVSMGAVSSIIAQAETGKGDFVIASVPYASFNTLFASQLQKKGLEPRIFLPFMQQVAYMELDREYQQFTAANHIQKITAPILLMGATNDDVVNGKDAEKIFDLANEPKEYWEVESRHDIFYFHPEEFKEKVLSFLAKYGESNNE